MMSRGMCLGTGSLRTFVRVLRPSARQSSPVARLLGGRRCVTSVYRIPATTFSSWHRVRLLRPDASVNGVFRTDNTSMSLAFYTSERKKVITSRERLKVVLKEYGPVAVVFHTVMSLGSLGGFYVLVNSGLDVPRLLEGVGLSVGNIGTGVGVFGVAYVCHKVFMPVRIFITITCVPLVVKALRARGWLKGPQQTKPKAD